MEWGEGKKARGERSCLACEHLFPSAGLLRGHLLQYLGPALSGSGLTEDFLFRRSSQGIGRALDRRVPEKVFLGG